ncbi:MAG: site-specific integrase, partial [Muribaculaceae bacterium]|nr:site-specific integrase [Muribaculaceae bacterium]
KLKEPVRLRAKKLVNGNRSLYLDTYIEGKRSYEFLRLYLIPEKTDSDKTLNAATLKAATAIKAKRILAQIYGKADIKTEGGDMTATEWITKIIEKKSGLGSHSSIRLMRRLMKHLAIHIPDLLLKDIDRSVCVGFADYLRSATTLNSKKTLSVSTQCELLNGFSIMLNEAVREGLMARNPMCMLKASERIKKPESTRECLSQEEVKRLIRISENNIKVGDDVAAFLFCCFCGLRYSDVTALKWENIVAIDGGKEIRITMKKTKRQVVIPLSIQASSLLPAKGEPTDSVFSFPSYFVTLRKLRKLAAAAEIKKKVTFHVSRHTFATMMLTAGAGLYTISKLIGHADIRTTQIYSKVVDRKKREAIALLDSLF